MNKLLALLMTFTTVIALTWSKPLGNDENSTSADKVNEGHVLFTFNISASEPTDFKSIVNSVLNAPSFQDHFQIKNSSNSQVESNIQEETIIGKDNSREGHDVLDGVQTIVLRVVSDRSMKSLDIPKEEADGSENRHLEGGKFTLDFNDSHVTEVDEETIRSYIKYEIREGQEVIPIQVLFANGSSIRNTGIFDKLLFDLDDESRNVANIAKDEDD